MNIKDKTLMKKVYLLIFTLCVNGSLFSQDNVYGLTEEDLNLLLGHFTEGCENVTQHWVKESFSWGVQYVVYYHDSIRIDFEDRLGRSTDSLSDGVYENYLMIYDSGLIFLITGIEKIDTNTFILTIASRRFQPEFYLENFRQITIVFLDDLHINIYVPYISGEHPRNMWKSAGPTVIQNRNEQ